MNLYIHQTTGVATAAITDTTPLAKLDAVLGATLHLDCVFHNGTTAVELPDSTNGVFVVKQDKRFDSVPLFGAESWTKADAPTDGYRFTTIPPVSALETLLGNLDSVGVMCQIAWITPDGETHITQKISLVVENSCYRPDETITPPIPSAWPAPSTIALNGNILIPDRANGNVLKRLVIDANGQLALETL